MIRIDTTFVQILYNLAGYSRDVYGRDIKIDGIDGPETQRVTRHYQARHVIRVDGIIGPQTTKQIIKEIQGLLNEKEISQTCLNGGVLAVDGKFEKVSTDVTKCFQKMTKITVDGIFYIETLKALYTYFPTKKPTPESFTPNDGTLPTGWTRIHYTRDSQDTNYTCGPSSLKMALSVYGIYYDEQTLTTRLGCKPKIGTENGAIIKFANSIGLKAWNEPFKNWGTLQGYLVRGWPVILRIASYYTVGGEHYVLLVGLNIQEGRVELGDPSAGGFRATTTTDLLNRIKKVNEASVIVIGK